MGADTSALSVKDVVQLVGHCSEDQAQVALDMAEELVSNYCRGNHVGLDKTYRPGVRSVILTVAARILANPGQVQHREQAGVFMNFVGEGFHGFTLGELTCLNRYRKRAI